MTASELARIDRSIEIKAAPERVWSALTTKEDLGAWFQVRIEGEVSAGEEVWMETTHMPGNPKRFRVRFVELTPPERFVWEWHPGAPDPAVDYSREPRTRVTFTLEPKGSGTLLSVAETGFDEISLARRAKVHGDNSKGWTEVLVWVQRYVDAKG